MSDDLLTPAEAAALLGIPDTTIKTWRTRGRSYGPKPIRISYRIIRYRRSDVEAFLREREAA